LFYFFRDGRRSLRRRNQCGAFLLRNAFEVVEELLVSMSVRGA